MKRRGRFSWSALSAELKRRSVYPIVAGYAVIGWILLQIAEVTFEPLGLGNWAMTGVIAAVIIGFPVVACLAWFFDLAATGIRLDRGLGSFSRHSPAGVTGPSVAVLPFTDMSPEKNQAYFCEGISEQILIALSSIPELQVAARTSSFQFGSGAGDVRSIGSALGVATLLEGSVRTSGNRLRVTAQLVKVSDGYRLWSRSFDEEREDIFAIQDEIATRIADTLLHTMGTTPAPATARSKDVGAYDFYLRGRHFLRRLRKIDIECALQMFRQAIEIDDEFALAWAGYADCHSLLVMYEDPQPRYREEALMAGERAVTLSPDAAETHASRGLAYLVGADYASAERELRKALDLNPGLFEALYYHARARFHQGDLAMAAELFRQASTADPADYRSRCLRVQILRGQNRKEEAASEARKAIEVIENHLKWNPDDVGAFHLGAGSLIALGDFDRARRWMKRALEIDPDDSVLLYNVACNLATMGEVDSALGYLEQAVNRGVVSAAWMNNDSDLDILRNNPRFRMLLGRIEHGPRADAGHR